MRAPALILVLLPVPTLAETPLRIDLQNDLPYLAQAEFAGEDLLFITVAGGGAMPARRFGRLS